MTEQEIIALAKAGDEQYLDILYDKYKHKILFIAKKYYLNDGNDEDIVQEGMFGFLKAIQTYDENKGVFYPYLKRLVSQQIINAIKKSNSLKNNPLNERVNLNNQGEVVIEDDLKTLGIPSDSPSPENAVLMEENKRKLSHLVSDKLSNFEKQVLQLYLSGFSYDAIIKKLNVNYKSVDNALSRIKSKLTNLKGV